MPPRKLTFQAGHYYHAYNRGVERTRIFLTANNYTYCEELFEGALQKHQVNCIAYCLMPNHYHFLLQPENEGVISDVVRDIFQPYVQAFNLQNRRRGTLFESRFKAVHVPDEAYLLHLCRYIHANPVKAGLVDWVEGWPYSNYLEWIGKRKQRLSDGAFVSHYFPARGQYQSFVADYLVNKVAWQRLEGAEKLLSTRSQVIAGFPTDAPPPQSQPHHSERS